MKKIIFLFSTFLLYLNCATIPPKMDVNESSVVAINIKIIPPIPLGKHYPKIVYFAKVDPNMDLKNQSKIIASNHRYKGNSYIYNAKPGTYIAVAAVYEPAKNTRKTILFPKIVIQQTKIQLKSNSVSYMGSYIVKDSLSGTFSKKNYDDYQKSYYEKLSLFDNKILQVFTGDVFAQGAKVAINKKKANELNFLNSNIENVKKTKWLIVYKNRINSLSTN